MHSNATQGITPLLAALQTAGLTYKWGFPFSLQVTKDGQQVTLRTKDDLRFLSLLSLDPVDFPYWRCNQDIPVPPLLQPLQPVQCKDRSRGQKRQSFGSLTGTTSATD